MAVKYDLAVVARTYQDQRTGEEKRVWQNIGAIHESKEGKLYAVLDPLINLAAVPRKEGDSRVFVSMFEPKAKEAMQKATAPKSGGHFDDLDDDIPF